MTRQMHKTLYLSYDGLTDPLGQSQVLPYLIGLSKEDYEITVISFEKENFAHRIPIIEELIKEKNLHWIPLPYTKRPPIISTLKDVYQLWRTVKTVHKKNPFDLIHCRSYITALIGLWMKRKKGVPFIFDMRGFWADERVDGKLWSLKNPVFRTIYNYFKRKEKQFLLASDQIVSLTEAGKNIILNKLIAPQEAPIKVIPCCVDMDHFDPEKPTLSHISRNALSIDEEAFVLGYVGSIGTWYMLPEMLAFFKVLLQKKTNAIFLFVTREAPDLILKEAAKLDFPENNLRIVAANREEVPSYLSLFDWSIFFIKPTFSKQASSPTKQGELMSMNIPIICNTQIGDTDFIVDRYQSGVLVRSFDEEAYKTSINEMTDWEMKSLRSDAAAFFGLEKGITSYAEVYEKCLQKA